VRDLRRVQALDRYGTPVEGLSWMPLRYDPSAASGSFLLRFEAGAASRPHEPGGIEEFVVLEGYLIDADGRRLGLGRGGQLRPRQQTSFAGAGGLHDRRVPARPKPASWIRAAFG
jgi:hypothetical protein